MAADLLRPILSALALSASLLSPYATASDAIAAAGSPTTVSATRPVTWKDVPTQTITADGVDFSFRELGQQNGGTPVVLLVHLAAVMDNWDPRVVDGLAAKRHVIAFDNRGIGSSTGKPANTMEQMADDAITGKAFLKRLQERTADRDKEIATGAYVAQLQALVARGQKRPANLSVVKQPVLVVNGDDDRMVPTSNSYDLAKRLPNSQLIIYPDAGHGGVFQYHEDFLPKALDFLSN